MEGRVICGWALLAVAMVRSLYMLRPAWRRGLRWWGAGASGIPMSGRSCVAWLVTLYLGAFALLSEQVGIRIPLRWAGIVILAGCGVVVGMAVIDVVQWVRRPSPPEPEEPPSPAAPPPPASPQ